LCCPVDFGLFDLSWQEFSLLTVRTVSIGFEKLKKTQLLVMRLDGLSSRRALDRALAKVGTCLPHALGPSPQRRW
jgi:hypothetical protein